MVKTAVSGFKERKKILSYMTLLNFFFFFFCWFFFQSYIKILVYSKIFSCLKSMKIPSFSHFHITQPWHSLKLTRRGGGCEGSDGGNGGTLSLKKVIQNIPLDAPPPPPPPPPPLHFHASGATIGANTVIFFVTFKGTNSA